MAIPTMFDNNRSGEDPAYTTAEQCWCCGSTRQPIYVDDTNGKMVCARCEREQETAIDEFWWNSPTYEDD